MKDIFDLSEEKARVASRVALEATPVLLDSPAVAEKRPGTCHQIYVLLRRNALTSVKIGKSRKKIPSTPSNVWRQAVRDVDPRLALEASPDRADLRARAIAGDPAAVLTPFASLQVDAISLAHAVDWLHGLAVEHHKFKVAQFINQWRALGCGHGAAGAEK